MLISFLVFFILFTAVGVASVFWRRETVEDYLLASREMPSWLVALSFGATISSGATFIGFAGLAYHSGITAIYTVIGLIIGDYIGWCIAGKKIRHIAQEKQAHTYPSLVGKLGNIEFQKVTLITSFLTVIFMGTYCAAQLIAGAKVGQSLFGWDFSVFVVVGALALLAYCWAGGIRASVWTDALQALVILFSLVVLIIAGLREIGGISAMWTQLSAVDPKLTDPTQFKLLLPAAVGWFFMGIGILGQPQLMVRHMVARSDKDIIRAKWIYMVWRITVLTLAVMSGILARLLIPASEVFDPELSIPRLWHDLLPPVLVGLLVAGLFSATMSTADSLLLAASSAMTQHLIPQWRNSYFFARVGTIIVITMIMIISMVASKNVLSLAVVAWTGMASSIVPLVIVQLLGWRSSQKLALTMVFSGLAVTILWRYGLGWHTELLDLVPGILTGFAVFFVGSALSKSKNL
jgi:sodium/proline symporter